MRRTAPPARNLGSINLSKFAGRANGRGEIAWDRLEQVVRLGVRFLDDVIEVNPYPLPEIDAMVKANRRIGLGVMGWADLLFELGIPYDSDEALALGHRVGVLFGGRLLQLERPEVVFTAPADPEVAAFVGVETVVPGRVVAQDDGLACVRVAQHVVEAAADARPGSQVLVCLRPEDVTLLTTDGVAGESSARNRLPGRVERVRPAGAQVRVTVDCSFPVVALVTRRSAQALNLTPGQTVTVSFKASAVHLIARAG